MCVELSVGEKREGQGREGVVFMVFGTYTAEWEQLWTLGL
jgi:hypothetical protein